MIIGIWILTITFIVIVLGEAKYRFFDKKEVTIGNKEVSKDWKENMDTDLDELSMEHANGEFVPSRSLAMRGSWRLAQNQVMEIRTFDTIRAEEYSKML